MPPPGQGEGQEQGEGEGEGKGEIYIFARGLFAVAGIQVQNVVEYVDTNNLRTFAYLILHVEQIKRSKH